ncbi:MAG: hypothetical protein DMG70_04490 [Acidobacteria bacterium]|nr:MAG: hypothetical protein DMG70_04490 [Acidobacteriota bacterium]
MDALFTLHDVMMRKQAEIIRVQREIEQLKDYVHRQEVRTVGAFRSFAIFLCGLLIGAMILLTTVSHSPNWSFGQDAEGHSVGASEQ